MIDKQQVALINLELGLKWDGLFRLVWADDEFETRVKDDEVVRLPKYSYCKECFVLERKFESATVPNEIKDWNGYEVIWAFQPLQDPNLLVCMFIAESLMNGVKKTLKDHYSEEKQRFDAEVEETYQVLENESPYLATMLRNREAIVVPENKNATKLRDSGDDS